MIPCSPVLTYLGVDPSIGHAAGFGGVILHGLSTYGFIARGLIKAIANNDPDALTQFGVRFTSPVKPGDALETHAWEVGPGPNGTTEISFITKNVTSGKVVTTAFLLSFGADIWFASFLLALVLRTSKSRKRASYRIGTANCITSYGLSHLYIIISLT